MPATFPQVAAVPICVESRRVEVLHHAGCPLFTPVLELVRDCLRELGIDAVISERVARYPSPTVLVDGRDVMGVPAMGHPSMRAGSTCRRASGWPTL